MTPFHVHVVPAAQQDLDEIISWIAERTHCVLFDVRDDAVRVLRVRGPGQPTVKPDEL